MNKAPEGKVHSKCQHLEVEVHTSLRRENFVIRIWITPLHNNAGGQRGVMLLQIIDYILLIIENGRRKIEIHRLSRSEMRPLPFSSSSLLLTGHLSDWSREPKNERLALEFGVKERRSENFEKLKLSEEAAQIFPPIYILGRDIIAMIAHGSNRGVMAILDSN